MKKTLKILALVLCLALAITMLTGCIKKEELKDETATVLNNIEEKLETTTEKQKEKTLERGVWKDNVYSNEFADITFKLPTGWVYSSDEEIAEMMNIGVDALDEDSEALAKLIEQTSVYDMVSNDPSTGASVMVMFEKTAMQVTTDFYIDKLKSGLEDVDTLNYEIGDVTTENVAGYEYKVLSTTIPAYSMVQKYYVRSEGKIFIDILVTYIDGRSDLNSIMSNFQ